MQELSEMCSEKFTWKNLNNTEQVSNLTDYFPALANINHSSLITTLAFGCLDLFSWEVKIRRDYSL